MSKAQPTHDLEVENVSDRHRRALALVDDDLVQDLMLDMLSRVELIEVVSDIPSSWVRQWSDLVGKNELIGYMYDTSSAFHLTFYELEREQLTKKKKSLAQHLAMSLSGLLSDISVISERNKPWAFLMALNGISIAQIIYWDDFDMSRALLAHYNGLRGQLLNAAVEHGIDVELAQSIEGGDLL